MYLHIYLYLQPDAKNIGAGEQETEAIGDT